MRRAFGLAIVARPTSSHRLKGVDAHVPVRARPAARLVVARDFRHRGRCSGAPTATGRRPPRQRPRARGLRGLFSCSRRRRTPRTAGRLNTSSSACSSDGGDDIDRRPQRVTSKRAARDRLGAAAARHVPHVAALASRRRRRRASPRPSASAGTCRRYRGRTGAPQRPRALPRPCAAPRRRRSRTRRRPRRRAAARRRAPPPRRPPRRGLRGELEHAQLPPTERASFGGAGGDDAACSSPPRRGAQLDDGVAGRADRLRRERGVRAARDLGLRAAHEPPRRARGSQERVRRAAPAATRCSVPAVARAGGCACASSVLLGEEGEHRRERELHHAEGLVEHKLRAAARRAVDGAAVQPSPWRRQNTAPIAR